MHNITISFLYTDGNDPVKSKLQVKEGKLLKQFPRARRGKRSWWKD
jgi:hypothetical protein